MFRDESSHVINKAFKSRARPNSQTNKYSAGQELASEPTSPQPAAESASNPPTTFAIDPKPSTISAPSTKVEKPKKKMAKRPRKSNRCRAPVLSALINDWSRSPSESSHASLDDGNDVSGASQHHAHSDEALSPEIQEQGTAFFFSRYVAANHGCSQNYAFIYDVWKPPPPESPQAQVDPVTVSMTAVGLAGLSQVTRSPELMTRAQESYGIALGLTHRALRDPIEVIKDTTMLAVLILGTFEFVSGHSPHTMRAWQDHVNGAATLANIRGTAQFRSKAGVRMFLMLCHTVLISCIQSGLPMPQTLIDLRREIPPSEGLEEPDFQVAYPIYEALQVRHDIKSGKLDNLDDIVTALSNIDDDISSILSALPASWRYHRVQLTQPDPRVFGQLCHVYTGLLQSTTWNMVRGIRMLLMETLVEQLSAASESSHHTTLSNDHLQLLARSLKMVNLLGQAIVASVPQHLGVVSIRDINNQENQMHTVWIPAKKQARRVLSSAITQDPGLGSMQEASGSGGSPVLVDPAQSTVQAEDAKRFMSLVSANNTIIWPLYILGMSSACSTEMQQYAIEGLRAIHQEAGLAQARVVAELLQEKERAYTLGGWSLDKLPDVDPSALPSTV
ncbi:hypothetical protein F66182_6296 [Fusarium sp. NRRL 66182]|nr:hypothetical protein F66182_6296 [Fusarium sp. NRRL 66182]